MSTHPERARNRKFQTEKTRDKIKTTQLINRLQMFAMGEKDYKTGKQVEMSPSQVKAIEVLLGKSLPSLQSIDQKVDLSPPKTEEEMLMELKNLVLKNPELLDLLRVH